MPVLAQTITPVPEGTVTDPYSEPPSALPGSIGVRKTAKGELYVCRKYPVPPFEGMEFLRPKPEEKYDCPNPAKPYVWVIVLHDPEKYPPHSGLPAAQRYLNTHPEIKQYMDEYPEQFGTPVTPQEHPQSRNSGVTPHVE